MARRKETKHFVTCDGCGLEWVGDVDKLPYGWVALELRLEVKVDAARGNASGTFLAGDFCTSCKSKVGRVFVAERNELANRFRAVLKRDESEPQGSTSNDGEPIPGVP